MKVGLTYDLRSRYLSMGYSREETAEFDKEDTIFGIENALLSLGFETERIGNIDDLVHYLSKGNRCDIVFNFSEGMHGFAREAQVPALLDAYRIPYTFSDPMVLSLTLHKGMTKRVIQTMGFQTPEFAVINRTDEIADVKIPYPLFVKPVAEGTSKGIGKASIVNSFEELRCSCLSLLLKYKQPVLVEKFLSGREFTIGVLGTGKDARVAGVMEIIHLKNSKVNIYSYYKKENYLEYIDYKILTDDLAIKGSEMALNIYTQLGCRDGGRVDFRLDENGVINFLEINPLAGLNPIHSDLPIMWRKQGLEYEQLISAIIMSAVKRCKDKGKKQTLIDVEEPLAVENER